MQVRLDNILKFNDTVAVALSGGCDSMCLLHFLCENAPSIGYDVIALNVEHGIRGEASLCDTAFVKEYCASRSIKLLTYSVDAPAHAKAHGLSLEQSARALRYECFFDAIKNGACNKVATAHHRDDNVETVLFNVFRGTGLKGLTGITKEREDGIIRPFLSVDRSELEDYASAHQIPFVTDQTNLTDDYTRNYIRHNIVPKIKKLFPELNQSVERLSLIAGTDDEFLNIEAGKRLLVASDSVSILLPCHPSVFSRAIILALKRLGVKKDWEKAHVDGVIELANLANGAKLSLPTGITAIKEYDKIAFYRPCEKFSAELCFSLGEHEILAKRLTLEQVSPEGLDLKSGLYADLDKIPNTAVIRTRKDGDEFTKFGGGTKLLNDYLTDKKIPLRERDQMLLLAVGSTVLAVFGVAISEKIKVEERTEKIIKLSVEKA